MWIKAINTCFLMIAAMTMFACVRQSESNVETMDDNHLKESLIEANKHIVKTEDQHISDFIERYGWEMEETGTGLRFAIIENGNGAEARLGKVAILDYRMRLITGDLIYSSEKSGYKEFEIGRGGVEAGLEEAVLKLRVGDRARVILPSHLAWGLVGDEDKIPPKSTLVYELKVIDFK